ncbi:hypothetical protein D8674_013093 [Pyrus ussuriensis x Pyrus communis]|uniref:Uncharacterized protein n=1 Tax=Pyrus ussuriensis x Pyrus communis TaxID=2448454 RepID=A0A5N5H2B8_9ROSA|nr:hypothetical protein D8674_013093 [Pyrus ussuriensis x Pyrus communis]
MASTSTNMSAGETLFIIAKQLDASIDPHSHCFIFFHELAKMAMSYLLMFKLSLRQPNFEHEQPKKDKNDDDAFG